MPIARMVLARLINCEQLQEERMARSSLPDVDTPDGSLDDSLEQRTQNYL